MAGLAGGRPRRVRPVKDGDFGGGSFLIEIEWIRM